MLTTEAFGGHGGIALYNRDLITGLCSYSDRADIVAIPRIMQGAIESIPSGMEYITDGLGSKMRYTVTALKTAYERRPFDLIICGHINLLPLSFLLHLFLGIPVLLFIYGIDSWQPTRSALINSLVRRVDGYVSISEITKKRFQSWAGIDGATSGYVLPNAVHMDKYGPGPRNSELLKRYGLQGKTILMTIGRLEPREQYKGFDEVLNVLPAVIKEIPDIVYVIGGEGGDRPRLEQKARALGVGRYVVFTGFIPEAEKADHLRLADAYLMPGRGEGFGFVYIEAMACGVPVLGSKADGSREALRDGDLGILVDPDSEEEIKVGIMELLKRPRGILPEGLDYFSYANFERRLHQIIDSVADVHHRGPTSGK